MKQNEEFKVIRGVEKIENNTLSHIKGGNFNGTGETSCCNTNFACNYKNGGQTSKTKTTTTLGAQYLSVQ